MVTRSRSVTIAVASAVDHPSLVRTICCPGGLCLGVTGVMAGAPVGPPPPLFAGTTSGFPPGVASGESSNDCCDVGKVPSAGTGLPSLPAAGMGTKSVVVTGTPAYAMVDIHFVAWDRPVISPQFH